MNQCQCDPKRHDYYVAFITILTISNTIMLLIIMHFLNELSRWF